MRSTPTLVAASKFSACRIKADSVFAKSAQKAENKAKCDATYVKCNDTLVRTYGIAEFKYGASCPTVGDVQQVRGFLSDGADRVAAHTPYSLLKTGQTTSYGLGSDGDVQAGTGQSFVDNGDGTVTDDRTGLMWEKKSDDGSIHDKDNTYTWSGVSFGTTNLLDGAAATTFLAALNAGGGFAGQTDWRLPNRKELESLTNLEIPYPDPATLRSSTRTVACTRAGTRAALLRRAVAPSPAFTGRLRRTC